VVGVILMLVESLFEPRKIPPTASQNGPG